MEQLPIYKIKGKLYFLDKRINTIEFAQKAYDAGLDAYGSWPFNIAHAYEVFNTVLFRVTRLHSFVDLHRLLSQHIPVIVSIWGKIDGAPKIYDEGHLLIVIGWDKKRKKVLCHDSRFEQSKKTSVAYDVRSFLAAWERSRRLAYCAEPLC